MRQLVFVLSKIYLYSTFYINIQQYAFSFSLNPNYFHSTKIFVQLQPKIISFDKNNFSTSTKNHFIQQQSFRAFKILSLNKIHCSPRDQSLSAYYSTSTKIISFNKNMYSTSTKIISFNKNIYSTSTKIISFKMHFSASSSFSSDEKNASMSPG